MPIYEYRCKKCMSVFGKFKSISSRDEKEICPVCGSSETERVISTFASNIKNCSTSFSSGG
ncbi:zinc ribbon domain-containing protein [Thermodesulfovibrio sp.]|jgi:putative FmdB family regulatory protein|uniref:FmdB family zinc ribbon protein n=1 Tax=Thermodesulfovibrio TaxID=28261 RepID=UPI002612E7DB|nr:zinc ribbon domain-containing protein [Thermodesulfovibrio sp.]